MSGRTIAAIATPLGEGSIGVIRISGDNAIEVADKVFCSFSGKSLSELKGFIDGRFVYRLLGCFLLFP